MAVRFGYGILYVPDVAATVAFYQQAFGLSLRFLHESGLYAELETGSVTLAFAGEAMAEMNGVAIRPVRPADLAPGLEIALVAVDPHDAYDRAVKAGSIPIKPVEQKPWGQLVGYVRDCNGFLVELCSSMNG